MSQSGYPQYRVRLVGADLYIKKHEEFVAFLRTAIGRGEPVYCLV